MYQIVYLENLDLSLIVSKLTATNKSVSYANILEIVIAQKMYSKFLPCMILRKREIVIYFFSLEPYLMMSVKINDILLLNIPYLVAHGAMIESQVHRNV